MTASPSLELVPAHTQQTQTYMDLLLSGDVKFDWSLCDKVDDRQPIPKPAIEDHLAEAFFLHGGKRFLGEYVILVGQVVNDRAVPEGISWLDHSARQTGIGFEYGNSHERGRLHPARRYSLKPPSTVEPDELYLYLKEGKCLPALPQPAANDIVIVDTSRPQETEEPALVVDIRTEDLNVSSPIAQAYVKAQALKERALRAEAETPVLKARLAELEAQVPCAAEVERRLQIELRRRIDEL